jgi:hypothetical protein
MKRTRLAGGLQSPSVRWNVRKVLRRSNGCGHKKAARGPLFLGTKPCDQTGVASMRLGAMWW